MRVLFDNNVGDNYDQLSPMEQTLFAATFHSHKFSLYMHYDLLEETTRLSESPQRGHLLSKRITWLLDLGGRLLADGCDIIESEIAGNTRIFEPAGEATELRAALKRVAASGNTFTSKPLPPHDSLPQRIFQNEKAQQASFRRMIGNPADAKKDYPSYSAFKTKWLLPNLTLAATNVFEEWKLDKTKLDLVVSNPSRFPYFHLHLEIYFCWVYLVFIENMRVGEGDSHDRDHLLYMHGLDLLVTDDKRLTRLFHLVHAPPKRVVSFNEFMASVKN